MALTPGASSLSASVSAAVGLGAEQGCGSREGRQLATGPSQRGPRASPGTGLGWRSHVRGVPPGAGVPDMVLLLPQDDPSGDAVLPLALSPQPPAFHPLLAVDLPVYVLQVRCPCSPGWSSPPQLRLPGSSLRWTRPGPRGHLAGVFSGDGGEGLSSEG